MREMCDLEMLCLGIERGSEKEREKEVEFLRFKLKVRRRYNFVWLTSRCQVSMWYISKS